MLTIYRASAGSGKTFQLTQDYIQLLFASSKPQAHRQVMAVTFTNKATEEMKSRILEELYALSSGRKSPYRDALMKRFEKTQEEIDAQAKSILIAILHDYSSFSISTIDRFFQQVIRAFAREIGISGGYALELDDSRVLEQAIDTMFSDLSKEENRQLLQWLTEYAEERIEQAEGWNLRQSIATLGKEIFKENYQHKAESIRRKLRDKDFLAAYRAKLRRIQKDFEQNVKDLATEALRIMAAHGLQHEDFSNGKRGGTATFDKLLAGNYSYGSNFLRYLDGPEKCYTQKAPESLKKAIEAAYAGGLRSCIERSVTLLDTGMVAYNTVHIILKHIGTLGILSDLAAQIKQLCDEQNLLLIADSNMLLNKIIDQSDAPFVYERTGLTVHHFMIDEFQDTSNLQWKNFRPLLSNSLASGNENLVVGDVKQSIYRWRNSDWKLLDEHVSVDFDAGQLCERNLAVNWRSDQNIVAFNNDFFRLASGILQEKLNSEIGTAVDVYPQLEKLHRKITHAYRHVEQQVSPDAAAGYVHFEFLPSEGDDGESWKQKSLERLPVLIEDLQERGYRPSDICVLVRKNVEEQAVVEYMLRYKNTVQAKSGYTYDVIGNEGLLIGSAASVRFILALLRLTVNPSDAVQRSILSYEYLRAQKAFSPAEALQCCFAHQLDSVEDFCPFFTKEEREGLRKIFSLPLFDSIESIISLFRLGSRHNEAVFLQAFQDLVYQHSIGKTADLNSFLAWWDLKGSTQCLASPENSSSIRIMTIHKSKGLDFKVVIMPFADWTLDSRMRNIIWCEPQEAPFDELPLLPVEYTSKLANSIFSEVYFTEKMQLYIDNLNLAYVAFTRAKHELFCFMPEGESGASSDTKKISSLADLLFFCLDRDDSVEESESYKKTLSQYYDAESGSFTLGRKSKPFASEPKPGLSLPDFTIGDYPSVNTSDRLRIRRQSKEYWLEDNEISKDRLNYGLIMHDVLRRMQHPEDEEKAIRELLASGRICEADREYIRGELKALLAMPQAKEWFAADAIVLNERPILTPSGAVYRPDRVILRDKKAIVVDYKFGDKENPLYLTQVKGYMDLMSQMGYQTKGFVCYVSLRMIREVSQ